MRRILLLLSMAFDSNLGDELSLFKLLLTSYSISDQESIMDVANWASLLHAGQKRASGEPYFIHPLSVAKILISMKMDVTTIMAAILHDSEEDTKVTREEITLRYGTEVEQLVNSVTKISMRHVSSKAEQSNKTIRKMFLAMASDVRVIIIKLSDKLHNMSTLEFKQRDKQIRTAQECLDIYAPLARTLGIYWLKMVLEDLSFSHINHTLYLNITTFQRDHEESTRMLLEPIIRHLYRYCTSEDGYTITAIPRNHYAIYRQLNIQSQPLDRLTYPYGIRIICQTEEDCYRTVGTIHSLYKPLDGHFRDFIAVPKENKYQSLHTTVMSTTGRPFEVQIRTTGMDQLAEFGVGAFWFFNNEHHFNPQDSMLIQRIKVWENLQPEADIFVKGLKNDMIHDVLTIFNPNGEAQKVGVGSTALDYAFKQGGAIGLGCTAININGSNVEFGTMLHHNQVVSITHNPLSKPKLAWLLQVSNPWTKAQITQWFHTCQYDIFTSNDVIFTWPLNEKPPDSIEFASCCNPNPSHDIKSVVSHKCVMVHCDSCLSINKNDRLFEATWINPKKIIYRYTIEIDYIPHPFGTVEKVIDQAGSQLIAVALHHVGRPILTASFTVEIATESKRLALEEALNKVGSIQSTEHLE